MHEDADMNGSSLSEQNTTPQLCGLQRSSVHDRATPWVGGAAPRLNLPPHPLSSAVAPCSGSLWLPVAPCSSLCLSAAQRQRPCSRLVLSGRRPRLAHLPTLEGGLSRQLDLDKARPRRQPAFLGRSGNERLPAQTCWLHLHLKSEVRVSQQELGGKQMCVYILVTPVVAEQGLATRMYSKPDLSVDRSVQPACPPPQ